MHPHIEFSLAFDSASRSHAVNFSKAKRQLRLPLCVLTGLFLSACSPPAEHNSSDDTRQEIDLIVEGDYVVSMDANDSVYSDAAVAVDKGLIVAIGSAVEILAEYKAAQALQGDGQIVMPGLINGHSHAAMTLLRGVADDLPLMEWLNDYIFPAEVEFVDADFVRIGTELACWEMIRGGSTTFVDMYYFPDVVADAVESCGMRALVSATTKWKSFGRVTPSRIRSFRPSITTAISMACPIASSRAWTRPAARSSGAHGNREMVSWCLWVTGW